MELHGWVRGNPVLIVFEGNNAISVVEYRTGRELLRLPIESILRLEGSFLHIDRYRIEIPGDDIASAKRFVSTIEKRLSRHTTAATVESNLDPTSVLQGNLRCKNCRTPVSHLDRYCGSCGVALTIVDKRNGLSSESEFPDMQRKESRPNIRQSKPKLRRTDLNRPPSNLAALDRSSRNLARNRTLWASLGLSSLALLAVIILSRGNDQNDFAEFPVTTDSMGHSGNSSDVNFAVPETATPNTDSTQVEYSEPEPNLVLNFKEDGWTYQVQFFWETLGISGEKNISSSPPGRAIGEIAPRDLRVSIKNLDEDQGRIRTSEHDWKYLVGFDGTIPYFEGQEFFDPCWKNGTFDSEVLPISSSSLICGVGTSSDGLGFYNSLVDDSGWFGYYEDQEFVIDDAVEQISRPPRYLFITGYGSPGCTFGYDFVTKTWQKLPDDFFDCELL